MSDLLLKLGRSSSARSAIRALGLPVSLPQALRRASGPMPAAPLTGRAVAWLAEGSSEWATVGVPALRALGARVRIDGPEAQLRSLHALAEGGARPTDETGLDGLVLDLTRATRTEDLIALQQRGPALVASLRPCARVLFLAPTLETGADPSEQAVAAAIGGVMRSLAKELGRRGATANQLRLAADAGHQLPELLAWWMSDRLAFVDGQELVVRSARPLDPAHARDLSGRTALVTGGARGIGAATARALADLGAHVLCVDREAEAEALAELAAQIGGSALTADVTAPDAALRMLRASEPLGGLDIVIHNAGITRDRTFARMSEDRWRSVLDVNLAAILRMHETLAPAMNARGSIIGLASVAGIAGNPGQTAYAATKAGVMGWARAAAPSLAEREITINAVAPGFIETQMTAKMPATIREAARRLASLNQGGQPEDVAQAIAFLASPAARGVTGQTLRVCGGALIGA